MARTPYKIREPGSLKEATMELVVACGGQAKAAELCRVSKSQIARYTDESDENSNCHMPADILLLLEEHAGQPIVTRYMAAVQNRIVLEIGDWREAIAFGCGKPSDTLACVAEETGKLMADAARALEAGKFDPKKAPRIRKECLTTLYALTRLLESLSAKAGQG